MYRYFFKRLIDLTLSFLALIILSPFFLLLACFVRAKLGSPVIFKQERPGRGNKTFNMYKFRSMTNAKGTNGELLPDSERLTKFGKWLRSWSLDELPQLLNILKGDMSIIGPRPRLVEDFSVLDENQKEYRAVLRPGLSGLAQVNGRNNNDMKQTFEYDLYYIKNLSFLLDLKILFLSIKKVLKKEGIVASKIPQTVDTGIDGEPAVSFDIQPDASFSEPAATLDIQPDASFSEPAATLDIQPDASFSEPAASFAAAPQPSIMNDSTYIQELAVRRKELKKVD